MSRIYLSLMGAMNEIIKINGDSDFDPAHLKKDQKERMNKLPVCLQVTDNALEDLELNHSAVLDPLLYIPLFIFTIAPSVASLLILLFSFLFPKMPTDVLVQVI